MTRTVQNSGHLLYHSKIVATFVIVIDISYESHQDRAYVAAAENTIASLEYLTRQLNFAKSKISYRDLFTGLIECSECGQKLIGKSGNGKNAKYFYYGHKRKMLASGDRHVQRCKIENIPTIQIEEAIIGRFKDLATDRALVTQLVRSVATGTEAKAEHQKTLMASREQERRQCKKASIA